MVYVWLYVVHVILCNKRYSFNENCSLNEITKGKNLFLSSLHVGLFYFYLLYVIWLHNVCGMKDMFCSSYSTYLVYKSLRTHIAYLDKIERNSLSFSRLPSVSTSNKRNVYCKRKKKRKFIFICNAYYCTMSVMEHMVRESLFCTTTKVSHLSIRIFKYKLKEEKQKRFV